MSLLTNLEAYWKLDEASGTATDELSTSDLTVYGSIGSGSGIVGTARTFGGWANQLYRASTAALQVGDIDFSIQAWVYATDLSGSMVVVSKDAYAAGLEYTLSYDHSSNRFTFSVASGSGWANQTTVTASNFGAPSTGNWYLLHAWHDAANNQIGISVNAGTANTTAYTYGVWSATSQFNVGADSYSYYNGTYWIGSIDEVGFWKKVLSSQERTDLYNGGAGLSYDNFGGAAGQPAIKRMGGVKFGAGPFQLVSGMKGW